MKGERILTIMPNRPSLVRRLALVGANPDIEWKKRKGVGGKLKIERRREEKRRVGE